MGMNIDDILTVLNFIKSNYTVSEVVAINITDFKIIVVYKDECNVLKEYSY